MTYFAIFAAACFFGWFLNYRSKKFPTTSNFHIWFTGLMGMFLSAVGYIVTSTLDFIKKLHGN